MYEKIFSQTLFLYVLFVNGEGPTCVHVKPRLNSNVLSVCVVKFIR